MNGYIHHVKTWHFNQSESRVMGHVVIIIIHHVYYHQQPRVNVKQRKVEKMPRKEELYLTKGQIQRLCGISSVHITIKRKKNLLP